MKSAAYRDWLRRLGPEGRCEVGFILSELARELVRETIRRRHPEYNERELRMAWFRSLLGDDLFRRAYPGEPMLG